MPTDIAPKPPRQPEYLGDGVYAEFDGYQVWVRTQREFGWHEIALEPAVYNRLREFARSVGVERGSK